MGEPSRRERSVAWQNRYVVPVLVLTALGLVILSWLAGGIAWWLAIPLIAFAVAAYVGVKRRNAMVE